MFIDHLYYPVRKDVNIILTII